MFEWALESRDQDVQHGTEVDAVGRTVQEQADGDAHKWIHETSKCFGPWNLSLLLLF